MQVGEHITVTGRVDEDWLEGSLQGRKGIFPASFIDHVPPGLSKVGAETKESSPVQQSGVNSKPAKVGVAQYKGVWQSTMECGTLCTRGCGTVRTRGCGTVRTRGCGTLRTRGCGTVQRDVAQHKEVWQSTMGCGTLRTRGCGTLRTRVCGTLRTRGCGTLRTRGVAQYSRNCMVEVVGTALESICD